MAAEPGWNWDTVWNFGQALGALAVTGFTYVQVNRDKKAEQQRRADTDSTLGIAANDLLHRVKNLLATAPVSNDHGDGIVRLNGIGQSETLWAVEINAALSGIMNDVRRHASRTGASPKVRHSVRRGGRQGTEDVQRAKVGAAAVARRDQ